MISSNLPGNNDYLYSSKSLSFIVDLFLSNARSDIFSSGMDELCTKGFSSNQNLDESFSSTDMSKESFGSSAKLLFRSLRRISTYAALLTYLSSCVTIDLCVWWPAIKVWLSCLFIVPRLCFLWWFSYSTIVWIVAFKTSASAQHSDYSFAPNNESFNLFSIESSDPLFEALLVSLFSLGLSTT